MPGGSFYAFPSVAEICNQHQITSHGLAMYLLVGADDKRGVACLGGESFGEAGAGFVRLSCAEPEDRLGQAVEFIASAITNSKRIATFLAGHEPFRLSEPYSTS